MVDGAAARFYVRIVRSIDVAEFSLTGDPALKMFLRFLTYRFFDRIGAASGKDRANDAESDGESLQARRIM